MSFGIEVVRPAAAIKSEPCTAEAEPAAGYAEFFTDSPDLPSTTINLSAGEGISMPSSLNNAWRASETSSSSR